MTEDKVTASVIEEAKSNLISSNLPFIMNVFEFLSPAQTHLLKAVCEGETRLNSLEVLQKYRLGTSGNAIKTKR